ncbi:hypothetical protein FXV75_05055 [Marinomonas sp. IMCC 4694]|nr:hypothetical protein FXV75_05055 [Marinomonas sp. IMCC 4694]
MRERLLSRLSKRSDHMLYSLKKVSDRYLTRDTKIFIIEYLLNVIAECVRANFRTPFIEKKEELLIHLSELKLGRNIASKDRVSSQQQFEQMQNILQYMLREIRNMPESYGGSRVVIKHHLTLIRYAHALAQRDLLVKQARQDLEENKKARALERYRFALSIIEKNGSIVSSKREKARLQKMIQDVEMLLFDKNSDDIAIKRQ